MLLLRLKCTRNFCLISIMFSIIFLKNVFFYFIKIVTAPINMLLLRSKVRKKILLNINSVPEDVILHEI